MDKQYSVVDIRTYAMQCDQCGKWRIVPNKKLYKSLEKKVFVCDKAKKWQKHISCLDVADFDDGEYITNTQPLVLRPAYPVPPKGFSKSIVIRGNKASRFADIYYNSLYGRILRSKNDVKQYFGICQKFREVGVDKDSFCFEIPREFCRHDDLTPYRIYSLCGRLIYLTRTTEEYEDIAKVDEK